MINLFKNINEASAPGRCTFLLFLFFLLGCEKPAPGPPIIENPYKWQVNLPWTQVHPHFSDGHYYLFPVFEKNRNLNFTKINEKSGEIIFNKTIFTDIDVYALNPILFEENDRLVYLHGKYIFQLDKNTGSVFAIDTFTNYISNTVRQDGYFTGSSYTDNFITYKYFEIIYEGGHYKEKLIHSEPNQNLGNWAGGSAPIKIKGKWVLEYSIIDFDKTHMNSWLITKDGDVTFKKELLHGSGCSFKLFDENNIYLICSDDRFICIDKYDFKIKWNINTISGGEYTMYKDNILVYNRDDRKLFHSINKYTGKYSVFSGFIPGNFARLNKDRLVYVGDGKFQKLALETLTYDPDFQNDNTVVGEFFGFSDKTKLTWNDEGWKCSPY